MGKKALNQLKYENHAWRKTENVSIFNSDIELNIRIQDDKKEGILDVQKEAYEKYLENFDKYVRTVPEYILNYYRWHFEEIDRKVELDEEDQKEKITEEELFEMIEVDYLCVERDGSFGWIIGCPWTEDGFAVLLSEEEPRIIHPDQLLGFHKLNDDTLGLLVHDGKNAWVGLEQNDFFGKDEDLRIEVEGSMDEGISPAQQKAYDEYLKKKEAYFNELSQMMLSIYTGSDEQADNMMSMGHKIMVQTALPKILFIDKEGNYGWICYTQWDDSYIGVLLSEKKQYFLSTNNLHHYSEVKKEIDNELGLLFPTYLGFESVIVVRLMDNVQTLPLIINARPENVIDEDIRKAYKTYLKLRPTFWNDIKGEMLFYYQSYYKDFENYLDIPEELNQENVNEDNVISILEFTKLFIRGGRIAWLCESPTEEDGLAFEFTDGKVEWNYQNQVI